MNVVGRGSAVGCFLLILLTSATAVRGIETTAEPPFECEPDSEWPQIEFNPLEETFEGSEQVLDCVARLLKANDHYEALLCGDTDSGERGELFWALAGERADAVVDSLRERVAPPDRLHSLHPSARDRRAVTIHLVNRDTSDPVSPSECHNWPQDPLLRYCKERHEELFSQGYEFDFLIATLPDPIDSKFPRSFDLFLGAISRAMESPGLDYVRDRHCLPWSTWLEKEDEAEAIETDEREYRRLPGVLIFRKSKDGVQDAKRAAAVLVVGETPSWGVHERAMRAALNISDQPKAPLKFLAPTFSGSTISLAISIKKWIESPESEKKENRDVGVVSGTATVEENRAVILNILEAQNVEYATTGAFNRDLQEQLWKSIVDERWKVKLKGSSGEQPPIAILVESSVYGKDFQRLSLKHGAFHVFPFPMNISHLRTEYDKAKKKKKDREQPEQRELLDLRTKTLDLGLGGDRLTRDTVPYFAPVRTSRTQDLVLANILGTIARERIGVVAIASSNVMDKLFLAHVIRQYAPNVRLATFEGDILLAHPNYSNATRGMIVISSNKLIKTDPLAARHEAKPGSKVAPTIHHQFASDGEQGIFEAVSCLMGEPQAETSSEHLASVFSCEHVAGQREVWVSVVGSGVLKPVATKGPPRPLERPETLPVGVAWIALLGVLIAILAYAVLCGPAIEQWERVLTIGLLVGSIGTWFLIFPFPAHHKPWVALVALLFPVAVTIPVLARVRLNRFGSIAAVIATSVYFELASRKPFPTGIEEAPPRGWMIVFGVATLGVLLALLAACKNGSGDDADGSRRTVRSRGNLAILLLVSVTLPYFVLSLLYLQGTTEPILQWVSYVALGLLGAGIVYLQVGLLARCIQDLRDLYEQPVKKKTHEDDDENAGGKVTNTIRILAPAAASLGFVATLALILKWSISRSNEAEHLGFLMDRGLGLAAGINPFVPITFLLFVPLGWMTLSLWRIGQLDAVPKRVGNLRDAVHPGFQVIDTVKTYLDRYFKKQSGISPVGGAYLFLWIPALVPVGYLILYYRDLYSVLHSIESHEFDWFISGLFGLTILLTVGSGISSWRGWSELRALIARLKELGIEPWLKEGKFGRMGVLGSSSTIKSERKKAYRRLHKDPDIRGLLHDLEPDTEKEASFAETWDRLARRMAKSPKTKSLILALAGDYLAWQTAFFTRVVVRHIMFLMGFMTVGLILVLLGISAYPFQPQRVIQFYVVGLVTAGVVVSFSVIFRMERNETLSTIAGTTPGLSWKDKGWLGRFGFFGALPTVGLLASQFPGARRLIFDWIQPLLKGLLG